MIYFLGNILAGWFVAKRLWDGTAGYIMVIVRIGKMNISRKGEGEILDCDIARLDIDVRQGPISFK